MIWLAVFGAIAVLAVLGICLYLWRTSGDWPLTFEEQATADALAAIPRPAELHHEDAPAPVLAALTERLDAVPPPGAPEEVMPSASGLLQADCLPATRAGLRVTGGAVPYRPRHGPTEPTAVWPRPPRQPLPPVLPPACGPAVAVLGALSRDIRDRIDFPHLTRPWADDTGTFTAIMGGGG